MATQKDLAEFHRVSLSAVKQWSKQKQRQKKVELYAGIDLDVSALIGEISRMVYLYNCQNIYGIEQSKSVSIAMDWSWLKLAFDNGAETTVDITGDNAKVKLESMLLDLKQFIYSKI